MSGHTPGPWWMGGQLSDGTPAIIGDGDSVVAILPGRWNGCSYILADARLIAAAPELLAALQAMVSELRLTPDIEADKVLKGARAAIAKATGEQV